MPDITSIIENLQKAFETNNELNVANYTAQLGDYYCEQAQYISDPLEKNRTYRHSAIAYNAALSRFKKHGHFIAGKEVSKKIATMKKQFLFDTGALTLEDKQIDDLNNTILNIEKHRNSLHNEQGIQLIEIESKLSKIDIHWGVEKLNILYQENFKLYQHVVSLLTEKIFDIIGHPPCAYAFAVIGSLGKLMPSSKSDLDAMLLIENEEHSHFFRLFTHLLCLLIIDIGETPLVSIRTPEMGWIYSLCEKDNEGFSVDVEGIPVVYGGNQLLASPTNMCDMIDKIRVENFAAINEATYYPRLLLGDTKLLERFNLLNHQRLQISPPSYKNQCFEYCLEHFNSILDEEMYIKHEWYRQFTEGLVCLARYYDVKSTNPCEIITSLLSQQIIHQALANDLLRLYILISYFLLKNYQVHHAKVQQILIQSQIIPSDVDVTVSHGHQIKTAKSSFQHEVVVHKMTAYDDSRYYLVRNKKIISESMPLIHVVLHLQHGFRQFLTHYLVEELEAILIPQSLTIDPKLLFEFATRSNHLSKNSLNIDKHKTNYLYFHLIEYFEHLPYQRYFKNSDGDAACLFMTSGIALIALALKLFKLDIASRVALNISRFIAQFESENILEQLTALDKRLPTLYVQFLFFHCRINIYDTTPNQIHSYASIRQASQHLNTAIKLRKGIDAGIQAGLFDDAYNDGSDDVLLDLYGPNLLRVASGKESQLREALKSYQNYYGTRDEITDIVCLVKIIRLFFRLNESTLEIINACRKGLELSARHKSSHTAEFYNALATVLKHQKKYDDAKWLYKKTISMEKSLERVEGIVVAEAQRGLMFFDSASVESNSGIQQQIKAGLS